MIYIAAVLADYSQALQLITVRVAFPLQHNRLSDAAMWPFTLLALSIRRGVDVICFWCSPFWTFNLEGGTTMHSDTMGTWKTRASDSGQCHELRKAFCYARRDLNFSGLCCFEPITQDAKFISVEGQRQQANTLWHTYYSLEMNSTLWWVWDLRWSLKHLFNAVFTRCQSREDCVPRDPHSMTCIAPRWGKNWQCSGNEHKIENFSLSLRAALLTFTLLHERQ